MIIKCLFRSASLAARRCQQPPFARSDCRAPAPSGGLLQRSGARCHAAMRGLDTRRRIEYRLRNRGNRHEKRHRLSLQDYRVHCQL